MNIKTVSEKDNPFMKRKELVVTIEHSSAATPGNAIIQAGLAREWKVSPEQVDIRGIYTRTGRQSSRTEVFVWQQPKVKDLSKVEEKPAEAAAAPAAA
jgi:ribosomal protein S24E